jgi:hypothetical protein
MVTLHRSRPRTTLSLPSRPTGNFRNPVMRKLPVEPVCRTLVGLLRRANHLDHSGHPVAMRRGVSADRHEA